MKIWYKILCLSLVVCLLFCGGPSVVNAKSQTAIDSVDTSVGEAAFDEVSQFVRFEDSIAVEEDFFLSTTDNTKASNTPAYVKEEATSVIEDVKRKSDKNDLVFVVVSDMHNASYGELTDSVVAQVKESNLHAMQGMKLIASEIDLDFAANLGDIAWGGTNTTTKQGVDSIKELVNDYKELMTFTDLIIVPGNHDSLLYSYDKNGKYLSDNEVASLIGSYGYKDFEDKKIRVIYLNTSEIGELTITGSGSAEGMTAKQLQWFANTLDLSDKKDATDWGILILSHHPLDWGSIIPAANCLNKYVTGDDFDYIHNGTRVYYDYKGKNAAYVIGQIHGHTHCLNVDNIHYIKDGKAIPSTVRRVAIPNASFYRNNEYGVNSQTEYFGIEFGEKETYAKKKDSKTDTAFDVVIIDKNDKQIRIINYGAGYNRSVCYGEDSNAYRQIYGKNRIETSCAIADALKEELGVEQFDTIILTDATNYPDALSGSFLANKKNAPILMVDTEKKDSIDCVQDYIKENLKTSGTIYILGGAGAVSDAIVEGLDGFIIKRLGGTNRYDTNLKILEEASVDEDVVLVCTGKDFADSLSASATGWPILLVGDTLNDKQREFLKNASGKKFYVIGGSAAISSDVKREIETYGVVNRVAGKNRFETSMKVANVFFGTPDTAVIAYGYNFPDGLCGGSLAYSMEAPLILTGVSMKNGKPQGSEKDGVKLATSYINEKDIRKGVALGGSSVFTETSVRVAFGLKNYIRLSDVKYQR